MYVCLHVYNDIMKLGFFFLVFFLVYHVCRLVLHDNKGGQTLGCMYNTITVCLSPMYVCLHVYNDIMKLGFFLCIFLVYHVCRLVLHDNKRG